MSNLFVYGVICKVLYFCCIRLAEGHPAETLGRTFCFRVKCERAGTRKKSHVVKRQVWSLFPECGCTREWPQAAECYKIEIRACCV